MKSNRAKYTALDQFKTHPEIAARLTRMALEWNATLPTKPDPACVSNESRKKGAKWDAGL